jgi:hypothetical protein
VTALLVNLDVNDEVAARAVGVQWELRGAVARRDQRFRHRSRAQSANFDPLQAPSRTFPAALQAAFRTRAGKTCSASKKSSIALIERLWRTLKDTLGLCLLRPLVAEDLLEKIALGLVHYAHFRPHQALGGATPAEIYFGRTPSHLSAIPPPRDRPGEGPMDLPFRVEYLDAEWMLPVLVRRAA